MEFHGAQPAVHCKAVSGGTAAAGKRTGASFRPYCVRAKSASASVAVAGNWSYRVPRIR